MQPARNFFFFLFLFFCLCASNEGLVCTTKVRTYALLHAVSFCMRAEIGFVKKKKIKKKVPQAPVYLNDVRQRKSEIEKERGEMQGASCRAPCVVCAFGSNTNACTE